MPVTVVKVAGSPSALLKYNHLKDFSTPKKVECVKVLGVFCPIDMNKLNPTPAEVENFKKKIKVCQQANLDWGFRMN